MTIFTGVVGSAYSMPGRLLPGLGWVDADLLAEADYVVQVPADTVIVRVPADAVIVLVPVDDVVAAAPPDDVSVLLPVDDGALIV